MYRRTMALAFIFCLFFMNEARAGQCSEYVVKAMRDEGLSPGEINAICTRAEQYARSKSTIFTPEKVKKDLEGRSLGPDVLVKVKSGGKAGPDKTGSTTDKSRKSGTASSSNESGDETYNAYVYVPTGETFDRTNVTQIKILQAKTAGNKAAVVAQVRTVSGEGKLRLRYEYVVDEWILKDIENLSFKEY